MNKQGQAEGIIWVGLIAIIAFLLIATIFGYSAVKPWFAGNTGEAELARAEQNRQITILEAKAKKESASLLAEAEIERAKGVAEANRIIGDSLKGNEQYLRYLWIDAINNEDNQIIYVPTEAGLPILEAGRNINK